MAFHLAQRHRIHQSSVDLVSPPDPHPASMNAGRSERSLDVSVDQPQASYVSDFHSLATKQLNIYHINVQISNPNLTLKSQTFKIQIPNLMTKIVKSQPQI